MALDATQKEKLGALLAQEHVAYLVTLGEKWPTANMQAFAETPEFDLLFIMAGEADKYQNLLKRPEATVLVDNRDVGKVPTFGIVRASMQGIASDVARERGMGIAQGDLFEEESVRGAILQKRWASDDSYQAQAGFLRQRPARHFQGGILETAHFISI